MALRRTRTENLALTMLARDGIAAIWTVHLAAARAYRDGNKGVAATITDIADAAERRVVAPRDAIVDWLAGSTHRCAAGAPQLRNESDPATEG
jgi:hypothetical protein